MRCPFLGMVSKGLAGPGGLSGSGRPDLPGVAATGVSWVGGPEGRLAGPEAALSAPWPGEDKDVAVAAALVPAVTSPARAPQKSPWQPLEHRLCHWPGPAALKSESEGVILG